MGLEQKTSQFRHGYFISARYLKFKLKVNIINYMAFIIIPFLNTFTAVLSVFLVTFLVRFFFVATATSTMFSLSLEIQKDLNIQLHV